MQKKMMKILSCLVVVGILMSIVPWAVVAQNDASGNTFDYTVPYLRQKDYPDCGQSACGPTSIAMIIRYYYPNSKVSGYDIYHMGTQGYGYYADPTTGAPAKGYRNVGFEYSGTPPDTGLNNVPDEFKKYYDGTYSGMIRSAGVRALGCWGGDISVETGCDMSRVIEEIRIRPLLLNVNKAAGSNVLGHWIVLRGYDDSGTKDVKDDDKFYINDPYTSKTYPNGEKREITYNYLQSMFKGNIITYIPDHDLTEEQRLYTVLVDNGFNQNIHPSAAGKFEVSNIDALDVNGKYIWLEYYNSTYGDWMYPITSGQSAVWTPVLAISGRYAVYVNYCADPTQSIVRYGIYDSNNNLLRLKEIDQRISPFNQNNGFIGEFNLEKGCYVKVEDMPANCNADIVKFEYISPGIPTKPLDIVLDTDRSGSMSGQKIIDTKNAATLFVDLLESQDKVGLVSFSNSATMDLHLTSDLKHAKSVIAGYSAGGSTNMGDALSKSIQELKANGRDDTIWSIIYFTDGQTNTGLTRTEILDTFVPEAVDSGIIIYTLGYGSGTDEDFLKQVAEATGGKYYFAPDSAKLMEIYIELSQKIKGMDKLAEFTGMVSQGETKTGTFLLESKSSFMRTFLIWPGSDLDLTVIDPSGNQMIPGPGVIYSGDDALPEYYEIYNPQIGEWTIEVYGKDVTGTTEDYTVMVFQPGALMQVKPTKWDVDYPLNRKMTFGVSEIAGNVDLTNVACTASDLTEAIAASTVKSLMKSQAEAEERGDVAIATLTKEVYAQNVNIIPANCFSFTPNKFSVPAGSSVDVQATLTLPSASIHSGTYSGNIYVNSSGGNATISVTAIITSVNTSTGTGTAYFAPDAGSIEDLIGLDESAQPEENPTVDFPHGLFSFNITGLDPGQTVNITITFPQNIPATAQYWKYHAPEGWYQIPMDSNDGDNIITITLQDGGIGDDDGVANGVIVDQGGPSIPTVVARIPTLTLTGLVALIGLLSFIAINKIRRRGK